LVKLELGQWFPAFGIRLPWRNQKALGPPNPNTTDLKCHLEI